MYTKYDMVEPKVLMYLAVIKPIFIELVEYLFIDRESDKLRGKY